MNNIKLLKLTDINDLLVRSLDAIGGIVDICIDEDCDCTGNNEYKKLAKDLTNTIKQIEELLKGDAS